MNVNERAIAVAVVRVIAAAAVTTANTSITLTAAYARRWKKKNFFFHFRNCQDRLANWQKWTQAEETKLDFSGASDGTVCAERVNEMARYAWSQSRPVLRIAKKK